MAHLVERHAECLNRLGLRQRVESLHQFGIARGLHGGAIQFLLNGSQVIGHARYSEMQVVRVFESHFVRQLTFSSAPASE